MKMGLGLVPLLILSLLVSVCSAEISGKVGVNYGQLGNNLPSPSRSVELIKSLKAKRVKIYNANPEILESLKNTNLKVSIMVPNQLISNISSNQTVADQWVGSNVVPFYLYTIIRNLLARNEILSFYSGTQSWYDIVPVSYIVAVEKRGSRRDREEEARRRMQRLRGKPNLTSRMGRVEGLRGCHRGP